MPGNTQAGCTVYWSASNILSRWPFLEYLPRPEPPREYANAYAQWKKEYSQWKGLKCSRQQGAYFCRRHGKWITCIELKAGHARPQHEEREPGYQCPASHYEWESLEDGFIKQHSADVEALEKQMAETEEAYQTVEVADPSQRLESELDQLHIGSSPRGEEGTYAYQQQDYYAGQSSYGESSSYAGAAHSADKGSQPQYRESKSSSSRPGPRHPAKGHRSQGSKSHSLRDSQSSKSTRATYSTTASSPPSESYYTQPIPATASDNRGEDFGLNEYYEPYTNSYQEDDDQGPGTYSGRHYRNH